MVDGNGIYHYRRFGSACQVGIECDIATIGVAKQVLCIDRINKSAIERMTSKMNIGDYREIRSYGNELVGYAYKSEFGSEPLVVSSGHKISMRRSVDITKLLCFEKIPKPIDLADKLSREIFIERGLLRKPRDYKKVQLE